MTLLKHIDLLLDIVTGIEVMLILGDTCLEIIRAVFIEDPINYVGELLIRGKNLDL